MHVQIINETLPALQQLKAQGLVRFIGITGLPLTALQYVLDRVSAGNTCGPLHARSSCGLHEVASAFLQCTAL